MVLTAALAVAKDSPMWPNLRRPLVWSADIHSEIISELGVSDLFSLLI